MWFYVQINAQYTREGEKLCEWLNQHPKIIEVSILAFIEHLFHLVSYLIDNNIFITTTHFCTIHLQVTTSSLDNLPIFVRILLS